MISHHGNRFEFKAWMRTQFSQFALQHEQNRGRTGAILIVVLVTVLILSFSAYSFCVLMISEDEAARLTGRRVKSRYLVDSGVEHLRMYLAQDEQTIRELGGRYNNENFFRGIVVTEDEDDPNLTGRFTVIAAALDDEGIPAGFRYGIIDESIRLNLNILIDAESVLPGSGKNFLMALPYMTDDVADAILDWMDPDDDIREYGAEAADYNGLSPPYAARNGPMDSIEELLKVRGVTPQLLFGIDNNHNGIIDPEELADPNAGSVTPDMQLGWANYLTLHSKETNLNNSGLQRININDPNLEQLYTDLRSVFGESWSNFIIGYRQNGPTSGTNVQVQAFGNIDFEKEAAFEFQSVLDIIGVQTKISFTDELDATVDSPAQVNNLVEVLPSIMSNLTTVSESSIPGRLNIMQAPRRMLLGVPGMTEEIADLIISTREFELNDPDVTDKQRNYETWILAEGIVDLQTMKTMLPFICVAGSVYRAEIVGYFTDGKGSSRAEVIIDKTMPIPRIVFWRDKSHLSRGYSNETLGIDLVQ